MTIVQRMKEMEPAVTDRQTDREMYENCRDKPVYRLVCSVQKQVCCLNGKGCEYGEGVKVAKISVIQYR
jgi:hypothetical protein